ncbi:hypothetical protein RND71_035184 [Anisodus tanguticus]|uniref:Uncharacterized protein n=1 Tax=Anisodus tanguticus TaxID=243964 RepID=A0AAE1UU96_9SOLA|nr:hypothetical protein RND71_035184 [Anisodus tanguticus]
MNGTPGPDRTRDSDNPGNRQKEMGRILESAHLFSSLRKISRIWFNPIWILAFQIKKRQYGALSSRCVVQGSAGLQGLFASDSCENSQKHEDLWVHKATNCDEKNENNSPKKRSKATEKWNKPRNVVFSMDKESCLDVPNLGGVSNLVRKWKDFENVEFVGSPQRGFDECDESCCSTVWGCR